VERERERILKGKEKEIKSSFKNFFFECSFELEISGPRM
jgi:hypothetical protein